MTVNTDYRGVKVSSSIPVSCTEPWNVNSYTIGNRTFGRVSIPNPKVVEDKVNHPSHYNESGIECIDAIEAITGEGFEYYLQGNIMKYLWRYRYKGGVEDLKKAQWYLNRMVEHLDKE